MTRNQAANKFKSWGNYINVITGLQEDIIEIRKTMAYNRGLKAVKTDGMPGGSEVSKPTENTAVKNIDIYEEEIREIEKQIREVKKNKDEIDKFVEGLEDIEQRLLRFRYIRKKSWNAVSLKIHLSDRQCYRVHNKILDRFINHPKDV